jgi:hypothetical protein
MHLNDDRNPPVIAHASSLVDGVYKASQVGVQVAPAAIVIGQLPTVPFPIVPGVHPSSHVAWVVAPGPMATVPTEQVVGPDGV